MTKTEDRFLKFDKVLEQLEKHATAEKSRDLAIRIAVPLITATFGGSIGILSGLKMSGETTPTIPWYALGVFTFLLSIFGLLYILWKRAEHFANSREMFVAVAHAYVEQNKEQLVALKEQVDNSKQIAASLTAKYEPLLVSWSTSGRLEQEAREVRCLTPNLAWLLAHRHFDQLAEDLTKHPDHSYHYLCFSNDIQSNESELYTNVSKLRKLLSHPELSARFAGRDKLNELIMRVQNGIKVKLLLKRNFVESSNIIKLEERYRDREYVPCDIMSLSDDVTLGQWRLNALHLPLPGDLVVYSEVDLAHIFRSTPPPRDAVVISRQIVASSTLATRRPEDEYDLILPHPDQVTATKTWFKEMWG